ncbi:MAG: N-acetylmuramate alpha-1-phosphate uridylyltransferase MurU [Burkholderiales bacterium]
MNAIILAAGRGERMRPLSDRIPKPLLTVGGASLIEWQVRRLTAAGIRDIVVNVSHLAEMIVAELGDGERLGARIRYSHEPVALETAGGVALALPLLGDDAFVAVNADIYCEYDYSALPPVLDRLEREHTDWAAYLVLIDNPAHHPRGDFTLSRDGLVGVAAQGRLTFSGIGAYRPSFFAGIAPGSRKPLGPMLYDAGAQGRVHGERFAGRWVDVGTPQRLAQLRATLGATGEAS